MEIKFDLTVVNWLAFVADPSISISRLGYASNEKEMLKLFLTKLTEGVFSSSLIESRHVLDRMKILLSRLVAMDDEQSLEEFYVEIRQYLGKKQWIALIIPSGIELTLDDVLCDPELLGYLVRSTSNNQGLILQLEQAPDTTTILLDIHESLKTVLNKSIDWPGIFVWSPGGDSIFLPVSSVDFLEIDIEARVQWIFSKLFSGLTFDLGNLKLEYKREFPEAFENENKTINILHLSDLYIGNVEANLRISRLQQFIRCLVEELGETSKIIPVITGNFMKNPSEKHINKVRYFWEFLSGMGTEEPLLVFGNNDVRKDGNINENYRTAVGFQNNKVTWYEVEKIAIVSLNTVLHGNLEHGAIGEEQLEAIEYEIERKKDSDDYKFVILMHHLPISYQDQDQAIQPFYKKIAGESFVCTEAVEGADLLFDFANKHSITVLLHGHQQIPLVSQTELNVPVVGCGRTIGIKSQFDGSVYFSINIISVNGFNHMISSRLLAIRKPEAGFVEAKRHEVIFRSLI